MFRRRISCHSVTTYLSAVVHAESVLYLLSIAFAGHRLSGTSPCVDIHSHASSPQPPTFRNCFIIAPPDAAEMARDIASGHYGDKAQRMQSTVYKVIAFWLLACVVMFGLLIWGMELREAA